MYVYKFTHIESGRSYIGQTWEEIYGVEGARLRRESHKLKTQLRKEKVVQ
jgi:hypothetical protein